MLIPSIDLMDGKIVQLVQGDQKKLEFENFAEWIVRFRGFPLVQLIDLDAAMGRGDNKSLVAQIVQQLPCQVGGGVRSLDYARQLLQFGAKRVIFGSSLVRQNQRRVPKTNPQPNSEFAAQAASELGPASLTFAIDSRAGYVAIRGWREQTTLTALEMIRALEPFCSAFLYTHIDTEGLLQGISIPVVTALSQATRRKLIVAGGVSTLAEVQQLDQLGIDAVVGMAIYTGRIDPQEALGRRREHSIRDCDC
jgi:phosphoribosylformimino-5-aminoimidazole carboxamide ribotide isomerase